MTFTLSSIRMDHIEKMNFRTLYLRDLYVYLFWNVTNFKDNLKSDGGDFESLWFAYPTRKRVFIL